jgi:hypothetical protein
MPARPGHRSIGAALKAVIGAAVLLACAAPRRRVDDQHAAVGQANSNATDGDSGGV